MQGIAIMTDLNEQQKHAYEHLQKQAAIFGAIPITGCGIHPMTLRALERRGYIIEADAHFYASPGKWVKTWQVIPYALIAEDQ